MVSRPLPTLEVERSLLDRGASLVAGADEVGRGAWAGPLTVAVVVVDPRVDAPPGVDDSKRLSAKRRQALLAPVAEWCVASAVGDVSAAELDRIGVSAALRTALTRALAALPVRPDALIMDGTVDLLAKVEPDLLEPSSTVALPPMRVWQPKADATCASVAAASIVAKEHRDDIMRSLDASFPAFGFSTNVGYPSAEHRRALAGYGATAEHRVSWAFVDDLPWSSRH